MPLLPERESKARCGVADSRWCSCLLPRSSGAFHFHYCFSQKVSLSPAKECEQSSPAQAIIISGASVGLRGEELAAVKRQSELSMLSLSLLKSALFLARSV